jgi:hypothetical protein
MQMSGLSWAPTTTSGLIIGAVRAVQCGRFGNVQTRPHTLCYSTAHLMTDRDRDSAALHTTNTPLLPRVGSLAIVLVVFFLIQPQPAEQPTTNQSSLIRLRFMGAS